MPELQRKTLRVIFTLNDELCKKYGIDQNSDLGYKMFSFIAYTLYLELKDNTFTKAVTNTKRLTEMNLNDEM